jgi:uncharacterized protein YerC
MGNTFRYLREVLMPWKETSVMEDRLRFVVRLLEGEGMSDVCREFGISRKTGCGERSIRERDRQSCDLRQRPGLTPVCFVNVRVK